MPIAKINLNESDVSAEIDLESLIGSAAKNKDVREVFFQRAYDLMLERLDNGIGADGKKLAKYSKAYKDSLEFAAFGKDSTVNMQLTSEMVNSLSIKNDNSKKFKIGFDGDFNNTKAYAHMTGYKGHKTLDGVAPKRLFFGWSDKELKSIASELKGASDVEPTLSDAQVISLLERLLG